MTSVARSWRRWRAIGGIDQLDKLAYVEFFWYTTCVQPAHLATSIVFEAIYLFYTNSIV